MQKPILHYCCNQKFWLYPEKFIYWEEENAIILSDVHLTKSGHFRKNGIAIPQQILKEQLHQFFSLLSFFKPKKVIIVGDFFHSTANKEIELFSKWRSDFKQIEFHLIKGNHDILKQEWYIENDIIIHPSILQIGNIGFVHEFEDSFSKKNPELFFFSGHIHPGIEIKIAPKQHLTLPCFQFTKSHCILPAFGVFTGLYKVKPKKVDTIFAIVNTEIIKLQ